MNSLVAVWNTACGVARGITTWMESASLWLSGARAVVAAGVIVLLCAAPFLWLGQDSYISIHDSLDSDVVWFTSLAKSGKVLSFSNEDVMPNVMNGLPRNALPPGINGCTALFAVLSPFNAYVANYMFVRFCGIVAMFVFLRGFVMTERAHRIYTFGIAVCFGLQPFYGVHPGIAISGMPLLAYVFLRLLEGRVSMWYMSWIVAYGLYSSLVYVGLFLFPCLVILYATVLIWRPPSVRTTAWYIGGLCLLAVTYVIGEWNILVLSHSGIRLHRDDMSIIGQGEGRDMLGVLNMWREYFLHGHYHAPAINYPIVLLTSVAALGAAVSTRQPALARRLMGALAICAGLAFMSAIWYWLPFAEWREEVGGAIKAVQWNRWYWLISFCNGLTFAVGVLVLLAAAGSFRGVVVCTAIGLQLFYVLWSNQELRINANRVVGTLSEGEAPSFRSFYAEALFSKVREAIGAPVESYRVVSVGIFPDVAIYNGFYALDSYQRAYPMEYKRLFRRIIARELAKSEDLRKYYDCWGSRCYLFCSEIGKVSVQNKNLKHSISRIDLDLKAFEEMGGRYILSAVRIEEAAQCGLKLLGEFEDSEAAWKIWLYQPY